MFGGYFGKCGYASECSIACKAMKGFSGATLIAYRCNQGECFCTFN